MGVIKFMAEKTVYFYNVELSGGEQDKIYRKHKNIIEKKGIKNKYKKFTSIKLYDEDDKLEENKIILDVLEFNQEYFFGRLGKQSKPGVMGNRDYADCSLEDVPTVSEESKRGIQLVNYFYFNYKSNILCITNTRGGANHKSFDMIVNFFEGESVVRSYPIPNKDGLDAFYKNNYSKIKSFEFESSNINISFLKNVMDLDEQTILEIAKNEHKVGIYVKADRGGFLNIDAKKIKSLIDKMWKFSENENVKKTKFSGNMNSGKVQEYDLKALYYRYKIDVRLYRYENSKKNSTYIRRVEI